MSTRKDLANLKQIDLVEFNHSAEAHFCTLVKQMILADGGRTAYLGVIQEVAYRLNISTETAKRYVLKYTARSAPFEMRDGLVTLRKRRTARTGKRSEEKR